MSTSWSLCFKFLFEFLFSRFYNRFYISTIWFILFTIFFDQKKHIKCAFHFLFNSCAAFLHTCAKGLEIIGHVVVKIVIFSIEKFERWLSVCQNIHFQSTSGKFPTWKKSSKFSWTKNPVLEFKGNLLSFLLWYQANFREIGHKSTKLINFGTFVPKSSATVNLFCLRFDEVDIKCIDCPTE